MINCIRSVSERSTTDGTYITWLPGFPLAGDFLLAGWSETDWPLHSHFDPLHFIFSAAKELGIQTEVSSLDNGYTGISQATHPAPGYLTVLLIKEKKVLYKEVLLIFMNFQGWTSIFHLASVCF